MSDTGEDESAGGVIIIFTADPAKQWEVLDAIKYTTKALRAQQLIVTEHDADSKKMQPRYAYMYEGKGWGCGLPYIRVEGLAAASQVVLLRTVLPRKREHAGYLGNEMYFADNCYTHGCLVPEV